MMSLPQRSITPPQTVNGVVVTGGAVTTQDFTLNFLGGWTQISLPAGCPDWTRYDGEYYAGTGLVYFLGGRGGATWWRHLW